MTSEAVLQRLDRMEKRFARYYAANNIVECTPPHPIPDFSGIRLIEINTHLEREIVEIIQQ